MGVETEEGQKALGLGRDATARERELVMTSATKEKSLWDHEAAANKRIIEETLRRYNGAVKKTAAALGITRVTLWRKMKAYGIKPAKTK